MTLQAVALTDSRLRSAPIGADLHGWSSLALLGGRTDAAAPWLFVTAKSVASLALGSPDNPRFVRIAADYEAAWPVGAGTLGGVVLDGDAMAEGMTDRSLARVLRQATQANAGDAHVLVVCGHRLFPRRLSGWREYRRPSAHRWRRMATDAGLQARTSSFVCLEGGRVIDFNLPQNTGREAIVKASGDRTVLRLTSSTADGAGMLDGLVRCAADACGTVLHLDRVAVRKIGKTAVFLSAGDGARFIMRIARSPVALSRAGRNYSALEWLHQSSVDRDVKACVPLAVARGASGGYHYFVETCLPGTAGPRPRRHADAGAWETEGATYISALHAQTQRRVVLDDVALTRLVHEPLTRVAAACETPAADRTLRDAAGLCEQALASRALPLVRAHGDFTESNCLFDAAGRLVGLVDWEVSAADALPFLDLLQLMPVRGEHGGHPRWQRFDAWMDLWREPERVFVDPILSRYVGDLGLVPETIPALILMQWVTHVADRIDARRDDESWMRRRVWQPLETLGRMLV